MSPIFAGVVASGISGHLNTGPVGSYDALATVTVPSGGLSSVVFAGIPQGYRHLEIRYSLTASSATDTLMTFNDDSGANYSAHLLRGNGASAQAYAYANTNNMTVQYNIGYSVCAAVIDILDYSSTNKNKTIRSLAGWDNNSSGNMDFWSGAWYSTNAINTIKIYTASAPTFSANSVFSLYGVK